jgi:hypothetical protein
MKKLSLITVFLFAAMSLNTVQAMLTNGDFSDGLNGWTYTGAMSNSGDSAFFNEDVPESTSNLSQNFIIPDGAQSLSFERTMISSSGGTPSSDTFTVSILDADTQAPLASYQGHTYFYLLDDFGIEEIADSASLTDNKVTLDVSPFANKNALLSFNFLNTDDGRSTYVILDNVEISGISVVPAPGAFLLCAIGIGIVIRLGKSKILR